MSDSVLLNRLYPLCDNILSTLVLFGNESGRLAELLSSGQARLAVIKSHELQYWQVGAPFGIIEVAADVLFACSRKWIVLNCVIRVTDKGRCRMKMYRKLTAVLLIVVTLLVISMPVLGPLSAWANPGWTKTPIWCTPGELGSNTLRYLRQH